MKAHIGVDALLLVTNTASNADDITQAHALLHEEEEMVFAV